MLMSSNGLRRSKSSKDVLAGTHCVKWNTNRERPRLCLVRSENNVDPPKFAFPQDAGIE
jgi:hypothetical protein